MKYFVIILIVLCKINLIYSNNNIADNISNDSCNIIKLDTLPKEILKIFRNGDSFSSYAKNKRKSILYVDYKKLNDSTNIYILSGTDVLQELIVNIPSYYFANECCIICIFTGNENPENINYRCIEPFIKEAGKYSLDSVEVLSKENLIFKEKNKYMPIGDVKIGKYVFIKGKIISEEPYYKRLYENNMRNKISIID